MGKHLLDETAEFRLPRIARHAAAEEDEAETTQRFDPGFRRPPAVPARRQDAEEK